MAWLRGQVCGSYKMTKAGTLAIIEMLGSGVIQNVSLESAIIIGKSRLSIYLHQVTSAIESLSNKANLWSKGLVPPQEENLPLHSLTIFLILLRSYCRPSQRWDEDPRRPDASLRQCGSGLRPSHPTSGLQTPDLPASFE